MVKESDIKAIGDLMKDRNRPLKERFRALFTLRNLGGSIAVSEISSCFQDPSALLKHELAYCLGQMGDPLAIPILIRVLQDELQEPMVRHEAGEALGAIGVPDPSVIEVLKKFSKDAVTEVAETCQLALERINWLASEEAKSARGNNSSFLSIDPAPADANTDISALKQQLLNESLPLFTRYRAMFALRNINTIESAEALSEGFKGSSALLRHEVAYVLGQMASSAVIDKLAAVLKNKMENEMVRHEAAEALGTLANDMTMSVLQEYSNDPSQVVRESCEIALDICDYENGSEYQYADGLSKITCS